MSLSALALLACGLSIAPAEAELARTFVSAAGGNDANDCSRTAPCRSFQGAHDKTDRNGEITVLDPGQYGAVTITRSISIANESGGEAGIQVFEGGAGVTINAPAAAFVTLRGLAIGGVGLGGTGLVFNSGAALAITNCVIRGQSADGIQFMPNGDSLLAVANTLVMGNGGFGILVQPSGTAVVKAELDHVEIDNNGSAGLFVNGEDATGAVAAIVRDSIMAGNEFGLFVNSTAGHAVTSLMVAGSVIANNRKGIVASGPTAMLRIGASTITGNLATWTVMGGADVRSFQENRIFGNQDGDPLPPTMARK